MTATEPPESSSPRPSRPSASEEPAARISGTFGMMVFLLSLSVLFLASIIGYLVVRSRAAEWPPPGSPKLPAGLWVSTVIILVSSGTIQSALNSVRRNRLGALIGFMLMTLLLAVVFLVSQAVNWAWLMSIQATTQAELYLFTFYLLTGLHAAHVIGGVVLLSVVTAKAFRGAYSPQHHPGVRYAAMYWHFLDGVWLVMFVLLFLV
jgi:cytochrome c oxidase subunit 3